MHRRTCALSFAVVMIAAGAGFGQPAAADDRDTCYKESGDIAIAACTRRIETLTAAHDIKNLSIVYNSRGAEYYKKAKYDHALEDYDESIKLNPKYVDPWLGRGMTYNKLEQYDRAIFDLDQAIKLYPKSALSFYIRGLAKQANGDASGGEADIARARRLKPGIGQ
jgi:tetratricopeptide (TPR) repeat protein